MSENVRAVGSGRIVQGRRGKRPRKAPQNSERMAPQQGGEVVGAQAPTVPEVVLSRPNTGCGQHILELFGRRAGPSEDGPALITPTKTPRV